MQNLATNGYSADQVTAAMLGGNGVVERRWRYVIYDEFGNPLRETISVIVSGGIRYVERQRIRRGGQISIDARKYTLTLDYLDYNSSDNEELFLPYLNIQITNENPIIYWRLGDTSGTTAVDSSGNGRNGTLVNTPTLNQQSLILSDNGNGSMRFTAASSEYVTIAHNAAFNAANFTHGAWIQTTMTSAGAIAARSDAVTSNQFNFRVLPSGYLELVLYVSNAYTLYTTAAKVNDGRTHYCVATYNGSHVCIYVDGSLVLKTAETRTIDTPTLSLNVGRTQNADQYFDGVIDEYEFYGYALSAAQIRARYQAGSNQLFEINFLKDQIKCFCAIKMQTAGTDGMYWAEIACGLFSFVYPDDIEEETGEHFDGLIQDVIYKLESQTVNGGNYTIAASKKYREAVADVLTAVGFTPSQYSITTSTIAESTVIVSKDYKIGTTYLTILLELLEEMNYRPVGANGDGLIILSPWVSPNTRETEFTLTAGQDSIIGSGLRKKTNISDTYNQVFLLRQGAKGTPEFRATATNTNASHPTSYPKRPIRTFTDEGVNAGSQAVIDALAQKTLEEKARIAYALDFTTALNPFHDNDDFVRIVGVDPPPLFSAAAAIIPENFLITAWELPFDDTAEMKLTGEFSYPVS